MALSTAIIVFIASAAVVAWAGTKLSRRADELADATGLGEAIVGAVLLGGVTSLSGIITSITAAAEGHPQLAMSNAVGSIAVQTAFLGLADLVHRRANLEHAAASVPNLFQGVLLIVLLTLALLASNGGMGAVWAVSPVSVAVVLVYGLGLKLAHDAGRAPMWHATRTSETVEDVPPPEGPPPVRRILPAFLALAALTAAGGYLLARTGAVLVAETGLSGVFVGSVLTGITSSLAELITTIAAVRQGALTLAVGNIVGGNTFDTLFLAFADVAYREGGIYAAASADQLFIIELTILLTAVLLLGLLHRQKYGAGNVGWESPLIMALFLGGYAWIFAG